MFRFSDDHIKPPLGAVVNWDSEFLSNLGMLVDFNHGGYMPSIDKAFSGSRSEGPTIITAGACRPRLSSQSHSVSMTDSWADNNEGRALRLSGSAGSASYIDLGEGSWIPTTGVTICAIVRSVSILGENWGFVQNKSGAAGFGATIPYSVTGNAGIQFGTGGLAGSGVTFNPGVAYRFVFTAAPTGIVIYLNGLVYASTATPATRSTSSNSLFIGNSSGGKGVHEWVQFMVLTEAWDAGKALDYSARPWAFMERDVERTFFFLSVEEEGSEVEFNDSTTEGLVWVEITDKLDVLRVHAKVGLPDPADYYGGWKDDRVVQWGSVIRALSDRAGQYEAATFSWTQADVDRLYRGVLDATATRVLKNRPATLRIIDDAGRRAELVPRTLMKGLIREFKPLAPLLWQWTMKDILAAKFSSENAQEVPTRTITKADFPSCPNESVGLPVPVIYGFIGSTLSATPAPTISGTASLGAYTNDGFPVAGFTPSLSAAAVPANVVVALAAGGTLSTDVPDGIYGVIVTAVDAAGVESDPQVYYYDGPGTGRGSFADGPLSPSYTVTPDGTQKIQVSWDASIGAVTYRAYLAWYYYGARFTQVIETASLSCEFTSNPAWGTEPTVDNITPAASLVTFGQSWRYAVVAEVLDGRTAVSETVTGVSKPYRRGIRVEWAAVAGALSYTVYRTGPAGGDDWDRSWSVSSAITYFDDDLLDTGVTYLDGDFTLTGQVPVVHVGSKKDVFGAEWYAFLVCGHAVKEITDVFQGGHKVDDGHFGVTFAVPGKTGYATYFPDTGSPQYLDINGNRYTLIFVRGPSGEAAAGHADEDQPITVNVKGIEDVGDGTGALITDGLLQYEHAVRNWILQTYLSGDWLDVPVFADDATLAQVDVDSFTAASVIAQARVSGGYVGAWMLGANGETMTVRDLVARLNISFDVDSGFNRRTQFFVSMVDDRPAALTGVGKIVDVRDIVKDSFTTDPVDVQHFNRIPYVYARDYTGAKNDGWNYETEQSDATSISDLDETKSSPDIELWCVRATGQAIDVIARRLLRSKEPPLKVSWKMGLSGLSVELGDYRLLTHFGGIGAAGYVNRPVRIIRHEANPDTFMVTIEAMDMQRLFEATFILGDRDTLPAAWTSATTAQQTYGYLCDRDTGLFSDGKRGKRLR